MSENSINPNPLIEEIEQAAKTAGKTSIRHDVFIHFDGALAADLLVQAWGSSLKNHKAAPSWQRAKAYADGLFSSPLASIAINEEGSGAIAFALPSNTLESIQDIRSELIELAKAAGSDDKSIEAASVAFDQQAGQWSFAKPFTKETASVVCSEFLAAGGDVFMKFDLDGYGKVEASHIMEMATTPPAGINAEPAPSGKPQYRSVGQMVKAGDAGALSEMLATMKKGGSVDPSQQQMLDQLLWHACDMEDAAIAFNISKVLLEEGGARASYRDASGNTPLLAACSKGHETVLDLLLANGSNIDDPSIDGKTALMLAAENDRADMIRLLVDRGAAIDATTLEGRTALHCACIGVEDKTAPAAVRALMELKADPTIQDMMEGALAEEFIDETNDAVYADLSQYRKDWEMGKVEPRTTSIVSKARAALGF